MNYSLSLFLLVQFFNFTVSNNEKCELNTLAHFETETDEFGDKKQIWNLHFNCKPSKVKVQLLNRFGKIVLTNEVFLTGEDSIKIEAPKVKPQTLFYSVEVYQNDDKYSFDGLVKLAS